MPLLRCFLHDISTGRPAPALLGSAATHTALFCVSFTLSWLQLFFSFPEERKLQTRQDEGCTATSASRETYAQARASDSIPLYHTAMLLLALLRMPYTYAVVLPTCTKWLWPVRALLGKPYWVSLLSRCHTITVLSLQTSRYNNTTRLMWSQSCAKRLLFGLQEQIMAFQRGNRKPIRCFVAIRPYQARCLCGDAS